MERKSFQDHFYNILNTSLGAMRFSYLFILRKHIVLSEHPLQDRTLTPNAWNSASRIDDYATTLLERLLQKRRQYKDHIRPIIFVRRFRFYISVGFPTWAQDTFRERYFEIALGHLSLISVYSPELAVLTLN